MILLVVCINARRTKFLGYGGVQTCAQSCEEFQLSKASSPISSSQQDFLEECKSCYCFLWLISNWDYFTRYQTVLCSSYPFCPPLHPARSGCDNCCSILAVSIFTWWLRFRKNQSINHLAVYVSVVKNLNSTYDLK
jgi:hypothetical protein